MNEIRNVSQHPPTTLTWVFSFPIFEEVCKIGGQYAISDMMGGKKGQLKSYPSGRGWLDPLTIAGYAGETYYRSEDLLR